MTWSGGFSRTVRTVAVHAFGVPVRVENKDLDECRAQLLS